MYPHCTVYVSLRCRSRVELKKLFLHYNPFAPILFVCVWLLMDTPGRVETRSRRRLSPKSLLGGDGDHIHEWTK